LTGVAFDDHPLQLPVELNFQMALLTASTELGRSCGKMEAYGWQMNQNEQARVDQIFNRTIDQLRAMGYGVVPETLKTSAKDITVFTVDSSNKHFMFMWSASDLGLVLNLCETSVPLPPTRRVEPAAAVQVFPAPVEELTPVPSFAFPMAEKAGIKPIGGPFTPEGEWTGSYTCAQGYTGGMLRIEPLHGKDFEGVFKFFPTDKNPSVPEGAYTVYGQYDKDSRRILINPGTWIKRPKDFYNTVIVGIFDPIKQTFSAYFEGVTGCTSFEARRTAASTAVAKKHAAPNKHAIKKKKKKVVKKEPKLPVETELPAASAPAQGGADVPKDAGIALPPSDAASASVATPAPAPAAPPGYVALPAPLAPAPAATSAPTPVVPAPVAAPAAAPASAVAPAPAAATTAPAAATATSVAMPSAAVPVGSSAPASAK
jgi:hypothetical protein